MKNNEGNSHKGTRNKVIKEGTHEGTSAVIPLPTPSLCVTAVGSSLLIPR
jgi:hypothetical protein